MNEHLHDHLHDHGERFETMIASWFDADGLSAGEREELTAHVATCASCRESFQLAAQMEAALVSRRDEVPAVDAFLPAFAPARVRDAVQQRAHPRLLAAFRALMSPAGVSIVLVLWAAMLALRFRHAIGEVFAWTSTDRFSALTNDISNLLLGVARGDALTLTAIYVTLALVVLGSTGFITLRYIRHS
jgi:hypothetical protein